MSENLKKITGKNPQDFEPVAYSLINQPDVKLFEELVLHEDFLFDFVKQNVANRLSKVCNKKNYLNLLKLMNFYSPSYEDFIVSTLVKYADDDLTDTMLELLENGSENEKTYCAKFFSYVQDPLSIDNLRANAYSENVYLSSNCASTLASMKDDISYNEAVKKLGSSDDFEVLEGVRFLVSYGEKEAFEKIYSVIKTSAFAENIAAELVYLVPVSQILQENFNSGLYILNLIINGLGEISSLSQIFDFQLYEVLEKLLNNEKAATILLNAYEKFNILTENDEYLYDESKETKQEVFEIKKLLSSLNIDNLRKISDNELNQDSQFVFTALEYTTNSEKVRSLLNSKNQTLILKAIEILKRLNTITDGDKTIALNNTTNENIKSIIAAI